MISVVMPVFNAAGDLPRSLPSLARQRWRDFEVILVDGGSVDDTTDVAARIFGDSDVVLRQIYLPGSSIYGAMNHGISEAKGEWIYILGVDDCLVSDDVFDRIQPQLRRAAPDVLVVYGDVWIEDPGYRYCQSWDLPRFLEVNISHQSAFYCRHALDRLNVCYGEKYSLYADRDYNLKLFAKGQFLYVPTLIASYACTGASSRRKDQLFLADKEANAIRYFGWRSCWLIPPDRFALGLARLSGPRPTLVQLINRFLWRCRRLLSRWQ
ncbi:MAG: glycosyltransferase [Cyanobium sp.]